MQTGTSSTEIARLATQDEAERCARMMAGTNPWLTLGRSYETCLKTILNPATEAYVARSAGDPAGFIIINMAGTFRGYIQTVCVDAERRGQGIGRQLIGWAEQRIFRESPNVFMCVSSFNPDAFRLYQRLGYSVVGELSDFLIRGHSELLLRKSLGPWAEFQQQRDGD